ncbi:lantibiotic dehydratase C-terminal domain-containing protein [Nonomuraea sp. NPDC050451]|uniref:lantibiotic dehydratase C-terminal domain-containing protein n=1 Tax=Nonomuraea sp. NPDC050451 TaxID=3364364 RepID=UPI0037A9D9EA
MRDAPYDSRRHVLGSDEAVDLLTAFYADATPLLFGMLEHVRAGRDSKTGLALSLMLTVAHTSRRIDRSYLSYRMHAEGFITWAADPAGVRASFEQSFRERRAALTGRVRDVVAALDDRAAPPVPFVREWAALLEEYRRRAGALLDDGRLTDPAFLRYRVLLNYTYLHLTRLGLTPLDRFRTCHLPADAVEDVYGLSGLDTLRRFADRAS